MQTPGGAKREQGYDRGVASCQGAVRGRPRGVRVLGRDSGGGSSTGHESKTHASHPPAEQASLKPLSPSPFFGSRTAEGLGPRARCQVRGPPTLGRDREGRRSSGPFLRTTPSSPPLRPPHLSHPARGPPPCIPDPRGTGPGTGRRRARYRDARLRRPVGAGARGAYRRRLAARPYLGGAEPRPRSAAASRMPPPAGFPEAAAGARFINAKALLLCFVPGIPLSIQRRPPRRFPWVCGAHSPPRPQGLALQSQPGSVWVPAAFPNYLKVLRPEHRRHKTLQEITQSLPAHSGAPGKARLRLPRV